MRATFFILDEAYKEAARELAPEFNNFRLMCGEVDKPESVVALITDASVITAESLATFPKTQMIVKMGRNESNIQLSEGVLRNNKVTLVSVPRKGPNCVAELAITLILALSKDLLMSHQSVATGAYRYRGLRPKISSQAEMAFHWMKHSALHEVRGKTLGIVGMGEIGCETALRANALGMKLLYHKRTALPRHLEEAFQVSYQSLNDLLETSDYVLLAVPHTPETDAMIGEQELARMKPSSYLVNICRGGVVDEKALIAALQKQEIAGAGLDVFEYEPLPFTSPLCQLHNVILTPHVGGGTGTNRQLELRETLNEATKRLSL